MRARAWEVEEEHMARRACCTHLAGFAFFGYHIHGYGDFGGFGCSSSISGSRLLPTRQLAFRGGI